MSDSSAPRLSDAAGGSAQRPRLAILFWFYKAFDICLERVRELQRLNPDVAIYGLYGGRPEDAAEAQASLGEALDDLYLFTAPSTAEWRWIHGDQVIAAWAHERGFALAWDTVILVQWDMLMAAPVAELFSDLRIGEAVFSGDRPLAGMEHWWGWGGAHQPGREALAAFRTWLQEAHGYEGPLWACLFILVALPRAFLERYLADGPPEAGFLEYKLSTLARLYEIPVRQTPQFAPWWKADPATFDAPQSARMLNAAGEEPSEQAIRAELARPEGARVFHPVSRVFSLAQEAIAPRPSSTLRCRICQASGTLRTHEAREMMFGLRDRFTYGECEVCGCVQLLDPPADLAPYYGPGYYSLGMDLDREFADPGVRAAVGHAVRALLTRPEAEARAVAHVDMRRPLWSLRPLGLTNESRILDVGCGSGRMLYLLHLAGLTGGIGADPFIAQDIAYADGPAVLKRELSEVEGEWDLIMLHHTFEHLADPAQTLADAAARLKPGGALLLRLPMADSEAWRIYRSNWVQLDAPRHFFLHTRDSLRRLAREAGLLFEAVVCDSHELQFWGSEQYRRDIPLHDPRSRWAGAKGIFPAEQIAAWRARSDALNAQGLGDQAAVYLRRPA